MQRILFLLIAFMITLGATAQQDFSKHLATARTAYKSGKLDDSRFAMQQMLQELDMMTGREILKILPTKIDNATAVSGKDEVSGASGFVGITIQREYSAGAKPINLEIITNSPLIGSLNSILSLPFLANNGDQKVVKIEGYKALIQKNEGDNGTTNYELQLPLNSSLITLRVPGYTQDQVIKLASALPISQIAKMVQ